MVEMSGTALAKVITAGLRGGARRRTSGLGCRGVVDGTAVVDEGGLLLLEVVVVDLVVVEVLGVVVVDDGGDGDVLVVGNAAVVTRVGRGVVVEVVEVAAVLAVVLGVLGVSVSRITMVLETGLSMSVDAGGSSVPRHLAFL